MKIKINIDVKVGKVVKYFIISDFFLLAGWGFIDPVFAVFIVEKIPGGSLAMVGIAAAIYWILKSILQIPIANYLDKTPGEKDDLVALIGGLLLAGVSAFAFSWVNTAWELYAVQVLHAVAFSLYFASWPTIFSRHLDKDRISFDWSLDSTVAGVAAGVTGLLGGLIASAFGFMAVFISAGVLSLIAALTLLALPELMLPKPKKSESALRDHEPTSIGM
jgi:MFS family permease